MKLNWKDWLFPRRCLLCGRVWGGGERFERLGLCPACFWEPFRYSEVEEGRSVPSWIHVSFRYEDEVRRAVAVLKFESRRDNGPMLGHWMYEEGGALPVFSEADLVVPVPLSVNKKKSRGYNQAALMAEALAGDLGIPMADLLQRTRDTLAQKDLGDEMRLLNVEGAFEMVPDAEEKLTKLLPEGRKKGKGLRIILVDDICTTGATMASCRSALEAGLPSSEMAGWCCSAGR
ncbi:MAG: ComF family protein [Lachnospiraceae bacterium]|nr:ComF family protein [Lachnospiraceae bacterium]